MPERRGPRDRGRPLPLWRAMGRRPTTADRMAVVTALHRPRRTHRDERNHGEHGEQDEHDVTISKHEQNLAGRGSRDSRDGPTADEAPVNELCTSHTPISEVPEIAFEANDGGCPSRPGRGPQVMRGFVVRNEAHAVTVERQQNPLRPADRDSAMLSRSADRNKVDVAHHRGDAHVPAPRTLLRTLLPPPLRAPGLPNHSSSTSPVTVLRGFCRLWLVTIRACFPSSLRAG